MSEERPTLPVLKPAEEITEADLADWPEAEVEGFTSPSKTADDGDAD